MWVRNKTTDKTWEVSDEQGKYLLTQPDYEQVEDPRKAEDTQPEKQAETKKS